MLATEYEETGRKKGTLVIFFGFHELVSLNKNVTYWQVEPKK